MAVNLDSLLITGEEQTKIRKNSASSLPLTPSAQGWSAQKIRERMYRALCSDTGGLDDNLLDVLVNKLENVKVVFNALGDGTFIAKRAEGDASGNDIIATYSTKTELDGLEEAVEDGTVVAAKAKYADGDGLPIISTYGVSMVLSYDAASRRLMSRLYSSDGSLIDTHYVDLPYANAQTAGLESASHWAKVEGAQQIAEKNVASGYAGLDSGSKIPASLLPDSNLGEFKTALGDATQSLSGLMSATDKARLDALHDLLEEDSSNSVVDSINEILAIFNQYPEGADIATALAGKVDKIADMGLSHNDYSDAEKNKVTVANAHALINNGTNPHNTTFANLASKPTTLSGFGITDAYTKAYVDSLKDMNGWSSELITQTPLTDNATILLATLQDFDVIKLFARNTATGEIDTDSFDASIGLVAGYVYKLFDSADITFTIGSENCVFDTIAGYELSIIGQKYEAQLAENVEYGDDSNVKEALDALMISEYAEVTHEGLQSEITATDEVEIKDGSGELVKITGKEPINLVSNGDLLTPKASPNENEPLGFVYSANTTNISLANGVAKFTPTSSIAYLDTYVNLTAGDTIYVYCSLKSDVASLNNVGLYMFQNFVPYTGLYVRGLSVNNQFCFLSYMVSIPISGLHGIRIADFRTGDFTPIEVDYIGAYNVSDMMKQGIKNDAGVLFSELTIEEIKEQLDIWLEQGYPTHISKLVSKSDNLFNGVFNAMTSLDSENLISNSDFAIAKASPNENEPLGFVYSANTTNISLANGVAKFTPTSSIAYLDTYVNLTAGDTIYVYCSLKSDVASLNNVGLYMFQNFVPYTGLYVRGLSVNNQFCFLSYMVSIPISGLHGIRIADFRTGDFTPIEVDYMGAINITDLVSRGILPSGLTNAQYKTMLDNAVFDNVPLRESEYIGVEPTVAYRLIKASENSAIHKVVEYAEDNQVVKVNSADYSGNVKISSPITMNALTRKIKVVSDLMDKPNLEIRNGQFLSTADWTVYRGAGSVANGVYTIVGNQAALSCAIFQDTPTVIGDIYYVSGEVMTPDSDVQYIVARFEGDYAHNQYSPVANTWYKQSYLRTAIGNTRFEFLLGHLTSMNGKTLNVRNPLRYNVSEFIRKGVADDNGTLFSRLTNDEIKNQMDIWTEVGFPDHVVNALYPSGADTAISLKYNDGDAIYYPQTIDELPIDITLHADEYWQNGYIVKANGNAEAAPLRRVFGAWNYGQIEAVYDSGFPADFKMKYAQNTSAQLSTHSEYLKEARERFDILRVNQEKLIDKLGIDVKSDDYDSFVGITSDKFEYYALDGIDEGDTVKVEIAGQSVNNLLVNTISPTITALGLTITYDDTTGMFTVNGTTTGAGNIILKTGMNFGLPVGTTCQLMRYFDSGTINLNGSYCGYVITGTGVSNRINENSESLYDPYINGVGDLKASGANPNIAGTSGQSLIFQAFKAGMVFTDFKFKVALYEGTRLIPFAMPETSNNTDVDVYNRTANSLDMGTSNLVYAEVSGITVRYNALAQEFVVSGTATGNNTILLKASVLTVTSGDRVSIKRQYQSGDTTAVSTLPSISLYEGASVVLANSIYKMTAPEGETPTPDINFTTATIGADGTLVLKLTFTSGDVFDNYRFRLMLHDKSTDIGYVAYNRALVGSLTAGANERDSLEFTAMSFGILEFIPKTDKLNIIFGSTITDTDNSVLEYDAGIQSANRKLSVLESRITALDNPFRDKVVAIWGDSRESNNPTSDPSGTGDQLDTSWPALLAKKLGATVLNFGLSGGAWAENTVQQDAASAIVNRVLTEDANASADVVIISSMNDFKLHTALGSPTEASDKTTFYGAMRMTYKRLSNKYPGKRIWLVLPQKRYDESTNYGGGDYLSYRKAQIEVAREYGIPTIDLYNDFPNSKTEISGGLSFYDTNMLNDTHFSAVGNDLVAELVMRSLLGNGNGGHVDVIPPLPTANGTYSLKVTVLNGVNTFSWALDS